MNTSSMPMPNTDAALPLLLSYLTLGWSLIPIWGITDKGHCACPDGASCKRSPGKHPNSKLVPNGLKNASRDPSIIREWHRRAPGGNWAVLCGTPIEDGFLLFLDVDPRNGGDESLAQIQGLRGELPATVNADSGGNGKHFALISPSPVHDKSIGPGLDVQGAGKYILVEPSRHISGGSYTWAMGHGPNDLKIAPAPAWLLEQASTGSAGRPPKIGEGTARDTVLGEAFALAGMLGVAFPDGNVAVMCPWHSTHSDQRGDGKDSSTVILPPAGGSRFGGFSCKHSHCSQRKWQDVLNRLPPSAVDEARRKYPMRPVLVPDAITDINQDSVIITPPVISEEIDACRKRLRYKASKGGGFKLEADATNAVSILTSDPRWKGILRFDEFAQCLRIQRMPPWHEDDMPREFVDGQVWSDLDNFRLHVWYKRYWDVELPEEKCHHAAYSVATRHGFHPLKDYLNGLVWDGVKRIETWTTKFLGTEDTQYHRTIGRKWLISAVARGLNPGVKADHLIILEGRQGEGKSTTLAQLVPDPTWFSDTPIDLNSKDAYVALRGKWILELAELSSLSKADNDRAKSFFSSPVDSYRPPFGREQVSIRRSCVFAGSINHDEYLNDETGNRRYWPLKTTEFDLEGLAAVRDQLWAESVTLYKDWVTRGSKKAECLWWPTREEVKLFDIEVHGRERIDPWTEAIARWTSGPECRKMVADHGGVSAAMVAQCALDVEAGNVGQYEMTRVARVLKRGLRWESTRKTINGARVWIHFPVS